jgi:plastocyanin domain-containing protein
MYKNISLLLLSILFSVNLTACTKGEQSPPKAEGDSPKAENRQEIRITVDDKGYHPSEIHAPANSPIRLIFTRTTDEGCGHQLAIPTLNIRRDLPFNEPVSIDITTPPSGSLPFTCGMDMYRGSVVIK